MNTHVLLTTRSHTHTHPFSYDSKKYQDNIPFDAFDSYELFDDNQVISSKNILLATLAWGISSKLIRACVVGQSFEGVVEIQNDQVSV